MTTVDQSSPQRSPRSGVGCSERLAGLRPKSPPLLPPLVETKLFTKEAMEKHIHNVYDIPVENRKKHAALHDASLKADPAVQLGGSKLLRTQAEVQEIFVRVGEEQPREKLAKDKQLIQRYEASYKQRNKTQINDPTNRESLSPRDVQTSVDRLYTESIQKGRDKIQGLVAQYCPPRTSPRRTKAEIETAANRMFRGEAK